MEISLFLSDEVGTLECAKKLSHVAGDTAIIFLQGQLGAGKTTFSRGFLQGLGFKGHVKSPTYTLVESYELQAFVLYHFDFYRIHDPHELEFMGIKDYFVPHAIYLIEWPENGVGFLPDPDISCYFTLKNDGREIKIISISPHGEKILKRFKNEKK